MSLDSIRLARLAKAAQTYLNLVKHAGRPGRMHPVMVAERKLMWALEEIENAPEFDKFIQAECERLTNEKESP